MRQMLRQVFVRRVEKLRSVNNLHASAFQTFAYFWVSHTANQPIENYSYSDNCTIAGDYTDLYNYPIDRYSYHKNAWIVAFDLLYKTALETILLVLF